MVPTTTVPASTVNLLKRYSSCRNIQKFYVQNSATLWNKIQKISCKWVPSCLTNTETFFKIDTHLAEKNTEILLKKGTHLAEKVQKISQK